MACGHEKGRERESKLERGNTEARTRFREKEMEEDERKGEKEERIREGVREIL